MAKLPGAGKLSKASRDALRGALTTNNFTKLEALSRSIYRDGMRDGMSCLVEVLTIALKESEGGYIHINNGAVFALKKYAIEAINEVEVENAISPWLAGYDPKKIC